MTRKNILITEVDGCSSYDNRWQTSHHNGISEKEYQKSSGNKTHLDRGSHTTYMMTIIKNRTVDWIEWQLFSEALFSVA